MNWNPRDSIPIASQMRSSSITMEGDETLDLFSRRRRSVVISSAAEPNGHYEAMKFGRSGVDDLLSSELGKHDYDWLLTPPGTPLMSSLDAGEHQLLTTAPKSNSNIRSSSTTKTSRLSVSQTENVHSAKPARSISAMRPSISSTHSSNYFSNNSRTSILNTSIASVTSRPSTPGSRSTITSSSRSSVPNTRPVSSRPSTPTRTRPTSTSPGDKPKPIQSSRPSTPNGRPLVPTNASSNSLAPRPSSRPSTPTRRTPAPVSRPTTTSKPPSRPSSPAPRARTPVHPITIPDFPLDVPPNLKTKLPERPASAGRTRPGMALSVRTTPSIEVTPSLSSNRRSSSPIVTRGRLPDSPKARLHSNGYEATPPDFHKSMASETAARKSTTRTQVSVTHDSTGFGRTISKKSLDMALKHMDIRQNIGGVRGTSLFPHSIRSSLKGRPSSKSDRTVHTGNNAVHMYENYNGTVCEDYNGAISENGDSTGERDPYGSYRYDAILLKEDSKNMSWLHSIDDKYDQSPEFDHRFEQLPEPFAPL